MGLFREWNKCEWWMMVVVVGTEGGNYGMMGERVLEYDRADYGRREQQTCALGGEK